MRACPRRTTIYGLSADMHRLILKLWRRHKMNIFMITHDLKEGFELGTQLLVADKVRLDPQAPGRYGATITYDIPLGVCERKLLDELTETTTRTAVRRSHWHRLRRWLHRFRHSRYSWGPVILIAAPCRPILLKLCSLNCAS
jgi:energy-coupling factor transporter ATP-binding protein EcfA2